MSKLKPYPKYNPIAYDYVSQLPEGWELLPNIAIFQERIERGFENEELLSVTIAKGVIKQGDIDTKKDSSNEDKSKYKLIKVGDIAYNRMRMWQGALGYSEYQGITSPAYVILKPKRQINQRFFHYMFRTAFYTNYSKRFSYGIVDDQLSLRYVDFKRMYSIVPPLAEQNAIVAYLDAKTQQIQNFIAKKQKLIQFLEEKKKAVIGFYITKGLNPNAKLKDINIEWLRKIPEHWKVKKLKYIAYLKVGNSIAHKDNYTDPTEAIPYISSKDIDLETSKINYQNGLYIKHKDKNFIKIPINSILLCIEGGSAGRKVAITDEVVAYVNKLCAFTKFKNIIPYYLYFYLLGNNFKNSFLSKMEGLIGGVSISTLGNIKIPLPPKEEQEQIVKKIEENVERINQAITQAQLEIEKLKEYQESLITQVVTGQLQVPMA